MPLNKIGGIIIINNIIFIKSLEPLYYIYYYFFVFDKEMVIAGDPVLIIDMKQRITINTVGLKVKKHIRRHIIIS